MKKIYLSALLAVLLLASCGNSEKQNQENSDTLANRDTAITADPEVKKNLDTADVSFFKNAAIGGLAEVETGSRMLVISADSTVKNFARMMVADHGKANKSLELLANKKGIRLPQVLPDSKLARIERLNSYKNDGRNEYYAHLMVEDHQNTIDLFNRAALSVDSDIAGFAKTLLPTLQHHLKMAKDLESKTTAHKVNQGDDPLKLSDKKTMRH